MQESNSLMQLLGSLLGPLLVILVVLAILGLFGWILWNARRKQQAREVLLSSLGFTRVQPSPEFSQRIDLLYRRNSSQRLKFTALFEKRSSQGDTYVFDLIETSGDDNTTIANGSVAVISADLNLPRVHVSGRMAFEGKVGSWMAGAAEKVIGWAAAHMGMERLNLDDMPEITERLMVIAADPFAARDFLTQERLGHLLWLADANRLSEIDCGGDCFIVKRAASQVRTSGTESDLRSLLDDARRAYTALS